MPEIKIDICAECAYCHTTLSATQIGNRLIVEPCEGCEEHKELAKEAQDNA